MPDNPSQLAAVLRALASAPRSAPRRLTDINLPAPPVPGLLERGTVDLFRQPSVPNPDGGRSTVYSFSVNFDGKEVLLPRVTPDGRLLSEADAIREYRKTGRHLGVFDVPHNATSYAKQLHDNYEAGEYDPQRLRKR